MALDRQEWSFGGRFQRRSKRRTEVKDRWRLSKLSGEYDEGFLSVDALRQLDDGRFAYRGESFKVEWLTGDEAKSMYAEHFAGWD